MTERVLVVNVGERDLYYNTGTEEAPAFWHFEQGKPGIEAVSAYLGGKPWGRLVGQEIHRRLTEALESESCRCAFPILDAAISLVTQEHALDRLILVATDQSEQTAARYRDRDTIYSAKIAKRLIEANQRASVRLVELAYYRKAPLRDEAYVFFGELLAPLAARAVELHACLSGGIPALNTALQEQAFRLFRGRNCSLYEVTEDALGAVGAAPHSRAHFVAPEPFLRDFVADMIERLLARYDYSGALDLLQAFRDAALWNPRAEQLLTYAERRANLDLKGAEQTLPPGDPILEHRQHDNASPDGVLEWALETLAIAEARLVTREYPEVAWRVRAIMDVATNHVPTPVPGDERTAVPYGLIHGPEGRRFRSLVRELLHFGGEVSASQLEGALPFLGKLLDSWIAVDGRECAKGNPYDALNAKIIAMLREVKK